MHICTTWESSSGIAEFGVNRKPLVRKGLRQCYSVGAHPKIALGQEQDSRGGKFEESQSFVGEPGNLYMQDGWLTAEDTLFVCQGSTLNPNILD